MLLSYTIEVHYKQVRDPSPQMLWGFGELLDGKWALQNHVNSVWRYPDDYIIWKSRSLGGWNPWQDAPSVKLGMGGSC
jgi:hypothetical protein